MSSSSHCANQFDRRRALMLLAAWPAAVLAQAGLPELTGWAARGQGRLRFLGLAIYDIVLWSPEAVQAARWSEQPLALALTYARSLKGRLIAERSIKEMERQGPLEAASAERWLSGMSTAFPDVNEGDRLTGRHDPQEGARFWLNGKPVGDAFDANFSRRFFGIWLSPQTSEPALRQKLLGLP